MRKFSFSFTSQYPTNAKLPNGHSEWDFTLFADDFDSGLKSYLAMLERRRDIEEPNPIAAAID